MTADARLGASGAPPPEAPSGPAPGGASATASAGAWTTLVAHSLRRRKVDRPVRLARLMIQLGATGLVVLCVVAVTGAAVSRRTAVSQSVHEAAELSDVLADSVVQPLLTDAMATDPLPARIALDSVVRSRVLSRSLVRVKVWTPEGRVLYSDETQLVGLTFRLDASAQEVLRTPQTRAEVSDLARPENRFERPWSRLLEVYRPIWTPSGSPLLFETYFRYDAVVARSDQLWRGFAGIMLSSLGAIFVLLLPLVWTLFAKARRAQLQREALIQRALDVSREERRRIAATLHDGAVQDLAAASFAVSGSAQTAATRGDATLAADLEHAAGAIRTSMSGMRSLLVDIYPSALRSAGLAAALQDLVATMSDRTPEVRLDVADAAVDELDQPAQEAVLRITQELLRNVVRHAGASTAAVTLAAEEGRAVLTVADDGVGFDPAAALPEEHFGLRLVTDLAASIGARLQVRSAPESGTTWRMIVP